MSPYRDSSEHGPVVERVSSVPVVLAYLRRCAIGFVVTAPVVVAVGVAWALLADHPVAHRIALTLFGVGVACALGGGVGLAPMRGPNRFRDDGAVRRSYWGALMPIGLGLVLLAYVFESFA